MGRINNRHFFFGYILPVAGSLYTIDGFLPVIYMRAFLYITGDHRFII